MAIGLLNGLQNWSIYWALAAVFLFTTLLTEVMSNAATVAMLIPIAAKLVIGLGMPPMAGILRCSSAPARVFSARWGIRPT